MADSQKEKASTAKTQKKSSISDDFGGDFLSSWKTMSGSDDDGLDFNKGMLPKGKKSTFNFDKMDMDFSLDGDFGKKLSSFNVDMPDLDFSSPPKKPSKPKEGNTEESLSAKQGGKQSRFTFAFDFNELDSFDFDSNLTKGKNKSDKATDLKGFDSPGKQEKVQTSRSIPAASDVVPEDSDSDKLPTSQHVSTSKFEHLAGGIGKFNAINDSPSTSADFGNLSPTHSTAASPQREVTVSAKDTDQSSQQSEKTISTEQVARTNTQDSSRSTSMEASAREAAPDTQGDVCSSATEGTTNPEVAADVSVKLCSSGVSPSKHTSVPKNKCDKILGTRSDVHMGDKPRDESTESDADVNDSSAGHIPLARPSKVNCLKSDLFTALPSELKVLEPMKGKGSASGGIQSKYFSRSAEIEPHLNPQSISKKGCIVGKKILEDVVSVPADSSGPKIHQPSEEKGTCTTQSKYFNKPPQLKSHLTPKKICSNSIKKSENMFSSPSDAIRQESTTNDVQAENQKVDNLKSHESAVRKGALITQGNGKNIDQDISAGSQVNATRITDQTVKSTAPKSLNSKLVTSIAAIRNSKSSSFEGNKLSSLNVAKKTPEASSLKESRLGTPNNASHSKAFTKTKTSRQSEKSTASLRTSVKLDHSVGLKKQGPLSPSMKRKMYEASNEDQATLNPLKRTITLPSEYRGPQEISERLVNKRIRTADPLNDIRSSSTLDVPRPESWKEIEVPLMIENDGNIEKAEAYAKDLEDICNMLKKKHKEVKELLVRAVVNNNYLLMLNNPIYEEKIGMIQHFAALMLSPGRQS